jgi:hypothetical protein
VSSFKFLRQAGKVVYVAMDMQQVRGQRGQNRALWFDDIESAMPIL